MYKWIYLTLFSHRGGHFLEIKILPAFLLAPHPQENFGCDSLNIGMYKWTLLNLISHKGGVSFLEMEILSDCLLAPHPHTNLIFVLKHWL